MKDLMNFSDTDLVFLTAQEAVEVTGGGFAYDFGFFVREAIIGIAAGGGVNAAVAIATDMGANYRPKHG